MPIKGIPLDGRSHLRLLVSGAPPFVLDVDRGRTRPIRSTPDMRHSGVVFAQDVGGRAAVIGVNGFNSTVYILRGATARPLLLGAARSVVPSDDGQSLWVKSAASNTDCSLRRVVFDGRQLGGTTPLECRVTLRSGGSLGLVGGSTNVFDPLTGRTVLRTRYGVVAAAGKRLVLAGPGDRFTLLDAETRAKRVLPWPSSLNWRDAAKADKQGRFVALAFADPAWQGTQAMDVWALDTHTGELTQVPGMPAIAALKFSSMEWTRDGRLVFLLDQDEKSLVAVWRPGERQLHVKRVRLPRHHSGGSDTFAILP